MTEAMPPAPQLQRMAGEALFQLNDYVTKTMEIPKLIESSEDVDFPGRIQPTLGKRMLTRPTGAMVGQAIAGELSDLLVSQIKRKLNEQKLNHLANR